jgi:hypothetical protein
MTSPATTWAHGAGSVGNRREGNANDAISQPLVSPDNDYLVLQGASQAGTDILYAITDQGLADCRLPVRHVNCGSADRYG